jgi:cell fate (sporulation/competence/biofilm development) regulator YmcA (YheA/YmcA/DUF963 family)
MPVLVDNDIDNRLDLMADNYSTRSDRVIQDSRDISDVETVPRVQPPIEPPDFIPPPTYIPPPPASVKHYSTASPLGQAGVSYGMESLQGDKPVQESQISSEVHGPSLRLDSNLEDPNSRDDSTFDVKWPRIQTLRLDNWSLRSRIHEMRKMLREKQHVKSEADDRLLQRISKEEFGVLPRKVDVTGGEKNLEELMKDCRDARGEYGPLEDDCNRLEDQLSEQEFELTRLEERFYHRWQRPLITKQEGPILAAFHHRSPTNSTVLDVEEALEHHPLVTQYLSRLGDLDLLQERLVELEEEKESLEEDRDSRQRFGMSLEADDEAWLSGSQNLLDELLEKISFNEEDVKKLRQECEALGLLDENGEPTDFQSQERSTFRNEDDMNAKDQISEYVKHPILLPKPGSRPAPSNDLCTESDEESASLGERINQWILDQLRESALEVNLLARTFEGKYGEMDESWEVSVLAVWNADGTANTKGYNVYTSSMTTQAPLRSDHSSSSSGYNSKFQGNQSYRFILAQRLRLPPSPDHSDETERGIVMGKSLAARQGKAHWSNQ